MLYLNSHVEFEMLKAQLDKKLDQSARFLQGAAVRCYGGEREYSDEERSELSEILSRHGLELSGWATGGDVYMPGRGTSENSVEREEAIAEEGITEGSCLVLERTLRSGASIQFDGHVIVYGDVNPGAEIIASGNIVVLGSLRGVAHAGAQGDRRALVSAYSLAPTQLRIADLVARSPDDKEGWRGPETARIKDEQLIVEGSAVGGWRGKA